MRKRNVHRILSIFLVVLMICSSDNMAVYATDIQKQIKVESDDGVQEDIFNTAASDKKGTCGESLSWVLADDGVLTIAGEGAMDDCAAGEHLEFYNYAEAIKSIIIEDGVTYIGSHAFDSMSKLVRVSMADSVTEIGEYAFANCDSLHTVKNSSNLEILGDGVFYGCTSISYSFPGSIKKVGTGLFENGGKYGHIQWPKTVSVIPERTFVGCGSALGSVRIKYGVTSVGKSAFENSKYTNIELPESVTEIQEKAFDSLEVKEVVITNLDCAIYDSELTIGTNVIIKGKPDSTAQEYAEKYGRSFEVLEEFETSGKCGDDLSWEIIKTFDGYTLNISGTGAMYSWSDYSDAPWYNCISSITRINIEEGITSIGDYAFVNSISLSEINLPNTITILGENAFYSSGLVEVEIPESVISIESDCFRHCYQLERVTLHEGLERINADAFCLCISLKQVPDFPESLTYLGREAFMYCSSMGGVLRLPENITNIYTQVFYDCCELSGVVTIPAKIESIKDDAFGNCTGIDKIVIYDNVESFLYDPFSNSGVVLCCYKGSYVDEWARENSYKVEYLETYTVSFDCNGGTSISDITNIHLGEKIKKPTDPTKTNYTFVNWYTSNLVQDEVTLWDFSSPIREDIILYAKWRGRPVQVSFDAQGGSVVPGEITVYYGEPYGNLPDASRRGYTFDGWYTECDGGDLVCGENICLISSDSLYVYARWVPNTYVISFDTQGGKQDIESKEVVFGQQYNQLPVPLREGYEFLGWSLSSESQEFVNDTTLINIVENTTLYAFWKAKTYNVSLDVRGGKVDTDSLQVTYGDKYPLLPIPKKDGCKFQGWFDAPQNGNQITENDVVNIANDHTIFAHWIGDERTVVLHPCGGVLSNNTLIQSYGAQYNLPIPEREGYIFLGWFTLEQGGTQIGENAIVNFEGTQDLYAHWDVIKYTILLDANGGSFDSSDLETISLEYGQSLEGRFEEPKFIHRRFSGWQDDEGNAISITDPIYNNMHLYAIWEIKDSVRQPKANYEDGAELEAGTKIVLSTETNNAIIKYSLNDGEYLEYLDGIVINTKTVLKAYAVKEGFKDSEVITYNYTIKDSSDNPGEVKREDIPNNDISAIPTGFWTADIADQVYTGKASAPEVRVYWGKKLLTNKTDYTVALKNNTNVGTATVTVSGKGNYSGSTVTNFEIRPVSIQKELDELSDLYVTYNANRAQRPSYNIKYNGKKLSYNKDFTVSWTNEKGETNKGCIAAGVYSVTIAGKGNYSGSVTRDFIIDDTGKILLSSAKITKIPDQEYEVWYDAEKDTMVSQPALEVKMGKETLIEYVDYTVEYSNNTNIGTATATIVGNGTKYVGTKSITFKIVGTNIKSFKIEGVDRNGYYYTGSKIDPDVVVAKTVKDKDKTTTITTLEKDKDYILTFRNDIKAGLATVTVTGTGAYFGSIKTTYKIKPYDMATDPDSKITVTYDASVPYAKGGVTPDVTVKFGETILVAGIDYTVSYANNKTVGNADKINRGKVCGPSIVIKGKGNYKNTYPAQYFTIECQNIDKMLISAPDKVESTKAYVYGSKPIITDPATNQKLTSKRDYLATFTYTYDEDVKVTQYDRKSKTTKTLIRYAGENVAKEDIIPSGAVIRVTVTGTGCYTGKGYTTYRVIASKKDISKATVKVADQIYTGKAIEPGMSDIAITMKVGNEIVIPTYKIIGYAKNEKKGTAKITLQGVGEYGGTKTVNFKIVDKSMFFVVQYMANSGAGTMEKQQISTLSANLTHNAFIKKGAKFVEWNTSPDGLGIGYSNGQNISAAGKGGEVLKLYAQWEIIDYSIFYNLNGGVNSSLNPETYNVLTDTIELQNPTREHYTFEGWYNGRKLVTSIAKGSTGDISLTARWTPLKYNIVFDANGGTGTVRNMSQCNYGQSYKLTKNAFSRKGYEFIGWNTQADGDGIKYSDQQTVINLSTVEGETITLYAQWEIITYTISYQLNGGINNVVNQKTYTVESDTIIIGDPAKDNSKFDGWYKENTFKTKVTSIPKGSVGDITLYAKWIPYYYTIVFMGNGATSGSMQNQRCEIGATYNLTANTFKKTYCEFVGWNTSPGGTGISYVDKQSIINLSNTNEATIILYAQWKLPSVDPSVTSIRIKSTDPIVVSANKWIYSYNLFKNGSFVSSDSWTEEETEIHDSFSLGRLSPGTYTLYYHGCSFTAQAKLVFDGEQMVYKTYYIPTMKSRAEYKCIIYVE